MKINSCLLAVALVASAPTTLLAQAVPPPVLPLYSGAIPDSKPSAVQEESRAAGTNTEVRRVVQPTLTVFLPDRAKATGTSVIICPGGGYEFLSMKFEGYDIAQRLTEMGVAAFVLKYRLPNDQSQPDKTQAPLLDVQQALRLVREQAPRYGLNPERIGVMGFSAGGHLAALAATRFARPAGTSPGPASVRPAFAVLVFPVISFRDSLTRDGGTRLHLLGAAPPAAQLREYSAESRVTAQTPPVFLVHAEDDNVVPVNHSIVFYQALVRHGVPAEMHLYPKGGHGFDLHNPATDSWLDRMQEWLRASGL